MVLRTHATSPSLRSEISFLRRNEKHSDSRKTEIKSGPVWNQDFSSFSLDLWPSLSFAHQYLARGQGKTSTDSLAFNFMAGGKSHDFEYFLSDPRSGWSTNFETQQSSKTLGSDLSYAKYSFATTSLYNLLNLDPPLWIVGFRTEIEALKLRGDQKYEDFPTHLKLRLGGSGNIRGFPRQSLPEEGAWTTAYFGLELRLANTLPFHLQPIFFLMQPKLASRIFPLNIKVFFLQEWASIGSLSLEPCA